MKTKKSLINVQKEFDTLKSFSCRSYLKDMMGNFKTTIYDELAKINGELWDIEDWIRDCEREKRFDKEFVELARSVYITNDKRCEVKKIININDFIWFSRRKII